MWFNPSILPSFRSPRLVSMCFNPGVMSMWFCPAFNYLFSGLVYFPSLISLERCTWNLHQDHSVQFWL